MTWTPLHIHSQYSILDSTASVQALAKKAKEHSLEALALTDFCNMHGVVDFYKACKDLGVKAIIGSEVMMAPGSRFDKKKAMGKASGYPLILLAKDKEGYRNLCKLSSLGFTEGFYYTPRIDYTLLKEHARGLICLAGSYYSEIAQGVLRQDKHVNEQLEWFLKVFKNDFYLELQRHEMSEEAIKADGMMQEAWYYHKHLDYIQNQKLINAQWCKLAQEQGIGLVASHDIHYIEREDWRAHEILMNIQSGEPTEVIEKDAQGRAKGRSLNPKREVKLSHEHYFKSPAQIETLFADIPEAIKTTVEIARQCQVSFDFNKRFYPVFIPPSLEGKQVSDEEREKESSAFLRALCEEGIVQRYTQERLEKVQEKYPGQDPQQVVRNRLNYELEIIISKGMCDYLLIVYDFIAWAKKHKIPMGPGRGSGAGSIVLYLTGITDIEPLRFNLFFERFINPERISYPDIDVDICMDRRSEVIDYTLRKYGKDKVAQIITFGTMKAKMAIKDVGRVLNMPLAKVNEIAKLVPEDPHMTLEKALDIDPDLLKMYEIDDDAKRIIDLGKKVEGSIRNTGIHAAGLIICGEPLTDHIPICVPKDASMVATQFSMKPVESVGMLKIDFLGLKTLTSIQKTVDAVKESSGITIDWVNLSLNDAPTFNLLNQGKTLGVFQLESSGMQELAKNLHIDKFEEIIAVGALYRPGPMEMIASFVSRKHGRENIEYDHPALKEILAETYGIMVYQEQVMQIASILANYSLGEGDLLRKAMGKKDKNEMARQKVKFKEGALQKGIEEKVAMQIFDKIEKFASYGFNKSHATAYGFLSYVTAYLKANYTKEWLAALMTCDIDDLTKVAKHIRECQTMGIDILPPDVNESKEEFVATSLGIRFAMSAIKGIGTSVVESIVGERKAHGIYQSLYDFVKRSDTKKIGKKMIETLITAGCFDFTRWERQALLLALDPIYESIMQQQKEQAKGFMDLFASVEDKHEQQFSIPPAVLDPVSLLSILSKEKELLGFFLTGHPMDNYQASIKRLKCVPFEELKNLKVAKIAFIIEAVQTRISKTQRKFAILTISDGTERQEVPVWPDLFEKYTSLLTENRLIVAVVHIEELEGQIRVRIKWMSDLTSPSQETLAEEVEFAYENASQEVSKQKKAEASRSNQAVEEISVEKKKELAEKALKLELKLNIDQMTHSHVIALKKLFRDYSGHIAVTMEFVAESERALGRILIQDEWGIRFDGELEFHLKRFPFIKAIQLASKN
jgi:DNA polymerase III subunit alpha